MSESSNSAPPDRRTQPRIDAAFRVRYRSFDDFVVAYAKDISQGGLFLDAENLRPVGSVVRIELVLPNDGPTVRIIGRVAYLLTEKDMPSVKKRGMGVEFLDVLGTPLMDQLSDYLTLSVSQQSSIETVAPARVLVVDDDARYRDRASSVLADARHSVSVATNGLEALSVVLRDPPDLIVSDVQMPSMDGWQFLRLVRSRPSVCHIPVMFLTTLSGEPERLRGYQLGVDDYIAKPFRAEELAARVARVLSRSRNREQTTASKNALRGDLAQVSLSSVLSFVEMERRTGHLLVVGKELATLAIRDGNVVQVDLPVEHSGKKRLDRLLYLLDWVEGRFELTNTEVTVEDSIGVQTSFALIEHARRRDEEAEARR
jgi:DNA-binding response OmpR family regulator/Tfp pilus assembly protein PilZ